MYQIDMNRLDISIDIKPHHVTSMQAIVNKKTLEIISYVPG